MKTFVETFRENIPYIADEIGHAFGGGSDSWSIEDALEKAEELLKDWISDWQTEERDKIHRNF